MSLRNIIEQAQSSIATYRHLDVSEAAKAIDEILEAGKLGGIGRDRIERLNFYDGNLQIQTSYSVRGCEQTMDYEIPETVIDAEDPILAIKVWAKTQRVAAAQAELRQARATVAHCEKKLAEAESEVVTADGTATEAA